MNIYDEDLQCKLTCNTFRFIDKKTTYALKTPRVISVCTVTFLTRFFGISIDEVQFHQDDC